VIPTTGKQQLFQSLIRLINGPDEAFMSSRSRPEDVPMTKTRRDNAQALDAFVRHKAEIDEMLARLQRLSVCPGS